MMTLCLELMKTQHLRLEHCQADAKNIFKTEMQA